MVKKKEKPIRARLLDGEKIESIKREGRITRKKYSKEEKKDVLDRYAIWKDFIDNAEKIGMDPVLWTDFLGAVAENGLSIKGAKDGRAIARRITPFMVLELSRLAVQAKGESVRQSALKEVAYMGGAKPADRIEFEDVSAMSVSEIDNVILEVLDGVIADAKRSKLGRHTADRYIEAEIVDDAGRGEEGACGANASPKESKPVEENRYLPPAQGPSGFPQEREEDEASGGGEPVGEDNGGCCGGDMVRVGDSSVSES